MAYEVAFSVTDELRTVKSWGMIHGKRHSASDSIITIKRKDAVLMVFIFQLNSSIRVTRNGLLILHSHTHR